VHWPEGIQAKGEIRSQFHHVIDIEPTILEAAVTRHRTPWETVATNMAAFDGVETIQKAKCGSSAEITTLNTSTSALFYIREMRFSSSGVNVRTSADTP
jgi:arylsulfatase A-like enzyme